MDHEEGGALPFIYIMDEPPWTFIIPGAEEVFPPPGPLMDPGKPLARFSFPVGKVPFLALRGYLIGIGGALGLKITGKIMCAFFP
jgi:hypothetical protein